MASLQALTRAASVRVFAEDGHTTIGLQPTAQALAARVEHEERTAPGANTVNDIDIHRGIVGIPGGLVDAGRSHRVELSVRSAQSRVRAARVFDATG